MQKKKQMRTNMKIDLYSEEKKVREREKTRLKTFAR